MPYVDFVELKARVDIEQVAAMLSLDMQRRGAQLRAPCPACQAGGDRALVITPAKQAFYCFGGRAGGDLIALVAHVRGCKANEAANLIAHHFGAGSGTAPRNTTGTNSRDSSPSPAGKGRSPEQPLRPLDYLEPEHDAVQALGVSPDTARLWGAGYAGKGIMRGRFAIPIHDREGTLLAYCGRAVSREQQPALIFPNGFRPESVIFAAHRIEPGPLTLVRDPLEVLVAFEGGVENVVAFLSDITPQSLEMLAGLMDEMKCETVELF
jgi:hypothetical protein